jgi:hypothetical protein
MAAVAALTWLADTVTTTVNAFIPDREQFLS